MKKCDCCGEIKDDVVELKDDSVGCSLNTCKACREYAIERVGLRYDNGQDITDI